MELVDIQTLGLTFAPFNILCPDHQKVRCAFYQAGGSIAVDANGVKNANPELASHKLKDFLDKAQRNEASFVVTPEYSCPWQALLEYVSDSSNYPSHGALWALGCESVTYAELQSYEEQTKDCIKWIYEKGLTANAGQNFFGPLIYVFQIHSDQSSPSLCILVQFKSEDLGGDPFERDNLIKGKTRYLIKNNNASIQLLGIICAESMYFDYQTLDPLKPYFLLHIQLNPKPFNTKMIDFRNQIFASNLGKNCEILSINWSAATTIAGTPIGEENTSSCYLMKAEEPNKYPDWQDRVIDSNHIKGTYISYSSEYHYSNYIFNTIEAVIVFDTTKVSQHQSNPQNCARTGVSTQAVYTWQDGFVEVAVVDDNFHDSFIANGGIEIQPTLREKLLTISTGKIKSNSIKHYKPVYFSAENQSQSYPFIWHKSKNLSSYCLGADQDVKGTRFKLAKSQEDEINQVLAKYSTLKYIIEDGSYTHYPTLLDDFKGKTPSINLDVNELSSGKLSSNLVRLDGKGSATVAFIGASLKQHANQVFNEIKIVLNPSRLVVWFDCKGKYEYIADKFRNITEVEPEIEEITKSDDHG